MKSKPGDRLFRSAWRLQGQVILIDLELMKPLACAKVNEWRDAQNLTPLTVVGLGTFTADEQSVRNIIVAAQMAAVAKGAGQPYTVEWSLDDNSKIDMSADQIISLGTAMGQRTAALYVTARGHKNAIEAATTVAEVEAVLDSLT